MSETVTTAVQQFEDGSQVVPPGFAPFQASASGVSSFNARTGAVTLTAADVDAVGAITNNTSGSAASATTATTATTANGVSAGSTVTTPNIVGVTNGSNAAAGSVGQFVQALVPSGSAVTLNSGVVTTIASISLTAGDWNVDGNVNISSGSGLGDTNVAGINTSVAIPSDGSEVFIPADNSSSASMSMKRFNLTATTTIYLVASVTPSFGSATGYGVISARRVR